MKYYKDQKKNKKVINISENFLLAENRKRYQIYNIIDYFLSLKSFFNFLMIDTFIGLEIKKIQILNSIIKFINNLIYLIQNFFLFKKYYKIQYILKSNVYIFIFQFYNFLIDNIISNILTKFKTPIISYNFIFFNISNLNETLKNNLTYYKFMKNFYLNEFFTIKEFILNKKFFLYLLQIHISGSDFSFLKKSKNLLNIISIFRNNILKFSFKINLFQVLNKEIQNSINLMNIRAYSL